MAEVPVVDLTAPRSEVHAGLRDAFGHLGFGSIVGHGIPAAVVDDLFAASRAFHAQPLREKRRISLDRSHRGFLELAASTDRTSTIEAATEPNQSESFLAMREDARADPGVYLSGPNQWPDVDGFRASVETAADAFERLAATLWPLLLEAVGIDPSATDDLFDPPTTWLRLLRYPELPADRPSSRFGSAPHTDFGAVTILAQDDVGGLQVGHAGAWIDVPPRPDALVVNVGDMGMRLTNGRLRSTPHRVVNPTGAERYSCVWFHDPHVNAVVAPLPGTGPPRWEPVRFGEVVRGHLEAGYRAHSPSPEF